jgi:hypothetical protein
VAKVVTTSARRRWMTVAAAVGVETTIQSRFEVSWLLNVQPTS